MNSPEQLRGGVESNVEAQDAAGEQLRKLHEQLEKKGEQSPDKHSEKAEARSKIEGLFSKESGKENRNGGEPSSGPTAVRRVTKREREVSYKKTMRTIQKDMNAPARAFSKVIHNPIVENTSEFVGKTVARPNAILSGSFAALILTAILLVVAKTYGYKLSGFETIGAFILGWVIGILFDYVRIMATGGRIK